MKYTPKTLQKPKIELELTRKDIRDLLSDKEVSNSDIVVRKTTEDTEVKDFPGWPVKVRPWFPF